MRYLISLSLALALVVGCQGPPADDGPGVVRLDIIQTGAQTMSWQTFDLGTVPASPSAEFQAAHAMPGQCAQGGCQDPWLIEALEDVYTFSVDTCVDCIGPDCPATGEVCRRGAPRLGDTVQVFWFWDGAAWVLSYANWPTGPARRYKLDADMLALPIPP